MEEIYKDIIGYEGHYQISNFGNVKSLKRFGQRKEILLKQKTCSWGYKSLHLCKNGKTKNFMIHNLVLSHFLGPKPKEDYLVNHKDGIKTNNNINNLEWCSVSENVSHAYRIGLSDCGEKHYKAKLNNEDVFKIKILLKNKEIYHSDIAKQFNVNISTIQDIYKGRSWKHHGLV